MWFMARAMRAYVERDKALLQLAGVKT
jgi:hypothetical protein